MRERDVEKYLKDRCDAKPNCEVRKLKWIGWSGAPDRVVMAEHCPTIFVECKATGKGAQAHQKREHKKMREAGQLILLIDSHEKVDRLMDTIDLLRKEKFHNLRMKATMQSVAKLYEEAAKLR